MGRKLDTRADELREEAERVERAAKATNDLTKKQRLSRIAEADNGKAADFENDFA